MKVPEQLQFMVNARMEQQRCDADLNGKVAVITGTTSGVGLAAARRFTRGGAEVVMVCRNPEKAEAVRPAEDDDAILRWNSCARTIMSQRLEPRPDEGELPLE